MTLINSSGKLFGRFNVIDSAILGVAALATAGILLVQSGMYRTSGEVIKGEGEIEYTVYIRNIKTLKPELVKPGEKLSITIRNTPRGKVSIVKVDSRDKKASFMAPNGELKTLPDPADPYGYDMLITLKDHALFSDEGYVTEGIKVKIGLPIEIEGKDYRVTGVIADVHEAAGPAPQKVNSSVVAPEKTSEAPTQATSKATHLVTTSTDKPVAESTKSNAH